MSVSFFLQPQVNEQTEFPFLTVDELPVFDQRYIPRWHVNNKAYYRKADENVYVSTQTLDLTMAGVGLYASGDLHVNDRLKLKIQLTSCASFQADGIVLWKNMRSDYAYAGVIFEHLSPDAEEQILEHAFVHNFYRDRLRP